MRVAQYTKTFGAKPFSGTRFVEVRDGRDVVRIRWTAGGKRRHRTIGPNTKATRDLADRILNNALRRAATEAEEQGHDRNLTLSGLLAAYLTDAEHRRNPRTGDALSPITLRNYRASADEVARAFDTSRLALSIRKREVREWVNSLRDRMKERTVAGHYDFLAQVYRWAEGDGDLLPYNPIGGLTGPSRKTKVPPYTPEELERLTKAAVALSDRAWRFRLMLAVLIDYGARASQALELRWDDIDLDASTITFHADRKGSKRQPTASLTLTQAVKTALLHAQNRRVPESPYVLWNWRDPSRSCRYDAMNEQLHLLEAKTAVPHIKGRAFHSFRRSLTTFLVESRGINEAASWIRDTPEVLMRTYNQPTDQAQEEALRAVEERRGT